MKQTIRDLFFGFLLIIAVNFIMFLVTIPFDSGAIDPSNLKNQVNIGFLLTAVPAGIVTYFMMRIRKVRSLRQCIIIDIYWAGIVLASYVLIGAGNQTSDLIFTNYGFYVMMACIISGPYIYAKTKKLK